MDKPIRHKKRSLWTLVLGVLFLLGLGYFIYTYTPQSNLPFSIKPLYLFFLLLFLSVSLLGTFLFKHTRRGVLLASCVCGYLLLRFNHLTEVYFAVLLIALFISVELVFSRYR